MAEGEGFEPPVTEATVVFKTTALNRSATPPFVVYSSRFTVNSSSGAGRWDGVRRIASSRSFLVMTGLGGEGTLRIPSTLLRTSASALLRGTKRNKEEESLRGESPRACRWYAGVGGTGAGSRTELKLRPYIASRSALGNSGEARRPMSTRAGVCFDADAPRTVIARTR